MTDRTSRPTALIVGASRGLGAGIAGGLAERGWTVVGTVRGEERTPLHGLAERADGRIEVEHLDVTDPAGVDALHDRLAERTIDLLFVSAGVATDMSTLIGEVDADLFTRVMVTNALSPMRVIERLKDLVPVDGLIGAMSSGQGSIADNRRGGNDLYRASKAALNMLLRGFAARPDEQRRACLLLAPGWIRTALGGDAAPYTVEESVPLLVDVLLAKRGRAGIEYLDRTGAPVRW